MIGRPGEVVGLVLTAVEAGHHAIRVVRVVLVRDRTHDRELVESLRQSRQMFADANSWQHGRDGAELAANALGSIGLGVEGIDVRRAAVEINEDDGLGGCSMESGRPARFCPCGRDGRSPREQNASAQEFAASDAIARRGWMAQNAKHGRLSRPFRLCQNVLHHVAVNVGQAVVAALEAERQPGVIDAQLVQDRRLQVVNVNRILDHVVTDLVGLAVNEAGLDAAAGEPHRVGVDVVVAADRFARSRPSACGRTRRPRRPACCRAGRVASGP